MATLWSKVWLPVWGPAWVGLFESGESGYEDFLVDGGVNFLVDDGSGGSEIFGVLD